MGRTSEARERLIETALNLIWENSYHSTGVSDICEKAGVKPGSFYYFFPSKRSLVLAAMEHHWEEAKRNLLDPAFQPDVAPLERIRRVFNTVYEFHRARQRSHRPVLGCAFGGLIGELGREDAALRNCLKGILSGIGSYFERALADALARGELNARKKEIPGIAMALLAYYEGILILARAQNDAGVIRELSGRAFGLLGN